MAENSKRSSRTSMRSKQIGQLLIESGDVSADQVTEALKTQDAHGGMLGAILRDMGACDDNALNQALGKQVQVTEIQCEEITAAADSLSGVSKEFCLHDKLCPFEALGGTLCIIMGNPLNRKSVTDVEHMTRKKVKTFKAPWQKIHDLIERSYAALENESFAPEMDPLSLELEGDLPVPNIGVPSSTEDEPLALDDDIIMPTAHDSQPAGPTGILEIPIDDEPLDEGVPAPQPVNLLKTKKAVINPTIKGLDTLDTAEAVIVNMAKRPSPGKSVPKVAKPLREAKVNVDLDKFDLNTASETVGTVRGEHEVMDEIERNDFAGESVRQGGDALLVLTLVPDSYFYTGSAPKNMPRADDLMDIIEALPVAEVLAPNINVYERDNSGIQEISEETDSGVATGVGLLGKNRIELQRAPATPMMAIKLGEGEFYRLTLTSIEDVIGEWDWKFTAPGPVAVEVFED